MIGGDLAFLGSNDVHARELLFEFLTFARRTLIPAFFKIADGYRLREFLFAVQTLELINRHMVLPTAPLAVLMKTFGRSFVQGLLKQFTQPFASVHLEADYRGEDFRKVLKGKLGRIVENLKRLTGEAG